MKTFSKGGVHPDDNKYTADEPIVPLPTAPELTIILSQSIGAPSKPIVKAGDEVRRGQMIAEPGGFVSAALHAPADGKVKKIEKVRDAQGIWRDAIILTVNEEQEPEGLLVPHTDSIVEMVRNAGIVGLGGACFPTHVKLSIPPGKEADVMIINGAECEPYLTCDDRLMREQPEKIIRGTRLLMKAIGVSDAIIGVEENKRVAFRSLEGCCGLLNMVELQMKYPQGGEKQLIQATTGREVPEGGLPIDVGCVVDNVATAYAVAEAIDEGLPLTRRVVTVTGDYVKNPGNFLVDIGTPIRYLIEAAGGLPENTGKVIAGGPMMGKAVSNLDAPTTKGLSGIVMMSREDSRRSKPQACIRCAKCIDACPMGLEPHLFMLLGEHAMWDEVKAHHVMSCVECGSCSYICPASRPLLDYIRLAKAELRKQK